MIIIKTPEEIKIMVEGGKILARIIKNLKEKVRPGITTKELDKLAEELVFKYEAKCSFKDYGGETTKPFPACLCVSINEEVVHSVPSERILKEGEIISLDMGVYYKGFHTDMAITVPVGRVDLETKRLIWVTRKALKRGIKNIKPGNTFGDISNAIQRYVEGQGFRVVKDLCGHGIGRELHEEPQILNYGKRKTGFKLMEGMVFCLEPIIAMGNGLIKKAKDNFGFVTQDNSLSCHFEHTVAVTKNGYEILTDLLNSN